MKNSSRLATATCAAAGIAAALTFAGIQPALAAGPGDSSTTPNTAVSGNAFGSDAGYGQAVLSHSEPANGTLSIGPSGDYSYTPNTGFTGTDSFTVSSSDAVKLFKTDLPPLGTFGGVTGSGYGSSVVAVPGKPGFVYGLTDRGPNVDGDGGVKVEPVPDFDPAIGEFQLNDDGSAVRVKDLPLKNTDGSPLNGQVNTEATTGETIVGLDGTPLPASPNGFDSEGLVAMPDGTFYVSDEYGPYIWHFDATGKRIAGGYSPFDGSLPAELKNRTANQGMEGLTLTPDGKTLVGLIQSGLKQPDLAGANAKAIPATRLVTVDLASGTVHEYLYLLSDPGTKGIASSEITALSNTEFLVDERDGNLPPAANSKMIYEIDISGATDVGPDSTVADTSYNGATGGLMLTDSGTPTTIEKFVGVVSTAAAQSALVARGITPVTKSTYLDLSATLAALNPAGTFFGHDKVEGVFPLDGGSKLIISNDSDFGLKGSIAGETNPFVLDPKINADGTQDQGEYLEVDLKKLPATPVDTTVSITVAPAAAGGSDGAEGSETHLAATGLDATGIIAGAFALLAAGAAVVLVRRRRA